MKMKQCLNYTDTRKPKYSKKNPFQYHLIHHKYHIFWPGIKHGPHGERVGD
jgi:hypothetical protein